MGMLICMRYACVCMYVCKCPCTSMLCNCEPIFNDKHRIFILSEFQFNFNTETGKLSRGDKRGICREFYEHYYLFLITQVPSKTK